MAMPSQNGDFARRIDKVMRRVRQETRLYERSIDTAWTTGIENLDDVQRDAFVRQTVELQAMLAGLVLEFERFDKAIKGT